VQVQAWVDATDNKSLDDIRSTLTTTTETDRQIICDIQSAITQLVGKAPQLIGTKLLFKKQYCIIGNFITNIAESWMHIRSKCDGSVGARLVRGKVGVLVLACVVMKVLDGGQHHGQKLSAQSCLTSSSYLQPMLSNTLIRIGSVRLNLLQNCFVKERGIAQPQ